MQLLVTDVRAPRYNVEKFVLVKHIELLLLVVDELVDNGYVMCLRVDLDCSEPRGIIPCTHDRMILETDATVIENRVRMKVCQMRSFLVDWEVSYDTSVCTANLHTYVCVCVAGRCSRVHVFLLRDDDLHGMGCGS